MRVFLVTQHSDDAELFRSALDDAYEICIFSNKEPALQAMDGNSLPDIFAVSMDMPEALSAIKQLKSTVGQRTVPVLAIINAGEQKIHVDALSVEATHALWRPLQKSYVRHIVDMTIVQNRDLYRIRDFNPKTNIYRKETFCQRTQELLQLYPEKHYVIVRWEIEHFSVLNDVVGSHECDLLLRYIGQILMDAYEQFVSYGDCQSGNFVLCMEAEKFSGAKLNDFLLKSIAQYFSSFNFSLRFGIYKVDDVMLDVSVMCDRASLAMQTCRSDGNTSYAFFSQPMLATLLEEQELTAEMNTALESGQFRMYLQPQYDYERHKIYGAEALARWIHPVKGVISPARFIPLFERNGFISRLDEYIWEQACIFMRGMLNRGLPIVPISINISRCDVDILWLIGVLTNLIKNYRLEKSYLRIEITESSYMEDPDRLIDMVNAVREHGFYVEIDDFGSGYSSLNMLKDIFVDALKLDMKFMSKTDNPERSDAILNYLVRMAQRLGISVIAEGIETKEQADYLCSIGCIYMQGYYFAKPMTMDEIEKLLIQGETLSYTKIPRQKKASGAANFFEQTTAIFNRVLGAAIIVERSGNRLEAMRMNDAFFAEIGVPREAYIPFQQRLLETIVKEDRKIILDCLTEASVSGSEVYCTVRLIAYAGKKAGVRIRVRVLLLSSNRDTQLFCCTVENISERKNKQWKRNFNFYRRLFKKAEQVVKPLLLPRQKTSHPITFQYNIATDTLQATYTLPSRRFTDTRYRRYMASLETQGHFHKDYHQAWRLAIKAVTEKESSGTIDVYGQLVEKKSGWYRIQYHSLADEQEKVFCVEGTAEALPQEEFECGADISRRLLQAVDKGAVEAALSDVLAARPVGRCDALLLLSIDSFSDFADKLERHESEKLCRSFGTMIDSFCRRGDIAVRFEAGSYLLYLRSVGDAEYAMQIAMNINGAIRKLPPPTAESLTCSIGGVRIEGNKQPLEIYFAQLDAAVDYIRQCGGNSFAFYTADSMELIEELTEEIS